MKLPTHYAVMALLIGGLLVAGVSNVMADFESGMNNFKAGKYVEAAAEFEAIVAESPEYDYGYYILGLCFLQMGKPGDAAKNFEQAIGLNGDKFEYYHGLAQAYGATKNHRKVVETLTTAEDLVEDKYKYHFYSTRGKAYASMKKWSESIGDLEKAAAIKQSTPILSQIGKAYYKLRHYDKAAESFKKTLAIDPNDMVSQKLLAESLMNVGAEERNSARKKAHYSEALSVAEKYMAKNSGDFDAANLVGRAALGAQQYQKGLSAFEKALQIKPNYCFAMVNRSKCFIALEKWTEAESALNHAASCKPDLAVIHDSLGFVLRKQDKLEASLKSYEKAYAMNPSQTIKKSIDEVKYNIEVRDHNIAADQKKAEEEAAIAAEEARVKAEEAKRLEYEKRTDDD
jgi:tetratricopeptide (TPR) repeat protein